MRAITKGTEPASLIRHRQTPHADYNNYAEKADVRQALVTEQRGLCCYCMGRIQGEKDSMKIEHWQCQAHHEEEQLAYRNLLGACLGGEGQPGPLQHCDTKKANQDLQWNPANQTHHIETRIRYDADGTIRSDDVTFDTELNDVLNLNLPVMKNHRKGVYDAVLEWWRREKNRIHGPIPRERLEREQRKHLSGSGILVPYCQVSIWLLGQKLSRIEP